MGALVKELSRFDWRLVREKSAIITVGSDFDEAKWTKKIDVCASECKIGSQSLGSLVLSYDSASVYVIEGSRTPLWR